MRRRFLFLFTVLALLLSLPVRSAEGGVLRRGEFLFLLWQEGGEPPVFYNGAFSDVPKDSPWAAAVSWAADLGLVLGDGQGHFFPEEPLTHEHLELILRRYDAAWGRSERTCLPGAWPGDPVAAGDGPRIVERFYREGVFP